MTDLRNPDLRVRDIRKLITHKYPLIKWDLGTEKEEEEEEEEGE
jgi:hypothetical protein